jgi:putative transposase
MLLEEIKRIFVKSKARYGSPRIAKGLEMIGIKASRQLVSKLMRTQNMRSIIKRKFKITTDSSHKYPVV